ncbi:hypothetical protein [Amycolatopsis plumensis]|uniref:Uncharacterized protein n=1 Tax=Amycolatopsis plumensis TaxID=236508 RepID=A0ABV5U8J5_9PSEU
MSPIPDFRVPDTAAESDQLRAAGIAAFGLWAAAGSWCMNPAHLTDGWVPVHYVMSWPSGKKLAAKLVEVGLWTPDKRNGVTGWQYTNWLDEQRSAASIEDEKAKARDRMKRIRSGNVRPNKQRTSGRTSDAPAANVHDSLTLTLTQEQGEESVEPVTTAPSPAERPSPRCPRHEHDEHPPPCGACGAARRAAEAHDATADTRRALIAEAIDEARRDPRQRCEHGVDGGLFTHPDTGKSATCAHCRRTARKEPA